jgi:hypothetical protein
MTPSERVYRWLLKAYPDQFRREYEEPMLQLLRDQLRACGGDRRCVALLWGRTLADTLRAAPTMHWEAATASGGSILRLRTALAVLGALLFQQAGTSVLHRTLLRISSPFMRLFMAHRPSDYAHRTIYIIGVLSGIDTLKVVFALALLLLIMKRFSAGRLARGAVVALAGVVLCKAAFWYLPMLRLLESEYRVVNWLMPAVAVALFVLVMKTLGIGRLARGILAAVPVAAAVASSYAYRGVVQLPLITQTVFNSIVLVLIAGLLLRVLGKLGIGQPARGILTALPGISALIRLLMEHGYLLLYHESIPAYLLLVFAMEYGLPLCLAVAAWAANAWGQGSDQSALPIPA